MKYSEKFQKYLNGELSEDECREIEEDIEKYEVLAEFSDKKIDDFLFEVEGESDEAMKFQKAVSKEVKRKILQYVAAVMIIVAVTWEIGLRVLSPLMDKIFYSPITVEGSLFWKGGCTEDANEFLEAVTNYRELYFGAKERFIPEEYRIKREGYGAYNLRFTAKTPEKENIYLLTLKRNKLEEMYWGAEKGEWRFDTGIRNEDFVYTSGKYVQESGTGNESVQSYTGKTGVGKKEILKNVEEKKLVRVAISFTNMKNIREVQAFIKEYEGDYLYIPMDVKTQDVVIAGIGYDPLKKENLSENGIIDKMKYLEKQHEFNRVFQNKNVITSAYKYLEENGVNGYGAVAYMSREQLDKVVESEEVEGISILDEWDGNFIRTGLYD